MKKAPLGIGIAVVCAAVVSAGLAATIARNTISRKSSPQAPVAQSTPSPQANPSPLATSSDRVTSLPEPTPQPKLDDFPHQRLTIRDDTARDREFAQFRQQVERAIQKRDAQFVSSLIPVEGVAIGFGAPQTLKDLNLADPKASFWGLLKKAMGASCGTTHLDSASQTKGWICPTVQREFYKQYPPTPGSEGVNYELTRVIVVGDRVNVRSKPSLNSSVVGVLSNEIVEFDRRSFKNSQEEEIEAYSPIEGWTAVILPNGQKGYVYNRYAYHPLENRIIFGKVKGQWQIVQVPGGD
ncbi:MAG: SH3 domain-containing protein [Leptolyngbyaceae cyanobacterium CSU_1_3]|nr:SH3 domain-containing protein [Leptolyngbyaceae cyanobacterium CSU_1_3]